MTTTQLGSVVHTSKPSPTDEYLTLYGRIQRKMATICVVGLGRAGVAMVNQLRWAKFPVVGYDSDARRTAALIESGGLAAENIENATCAEIIIVCVSPDANNGASLQAISDAIPPGDKFVVVESSTAPGETERIFGRHRWLAFCPRRCDGRLTAGRGLQSVCLAEILYSLAGFDSVYLAPDIRTAEAAKLMEATYRAVNTALVNELARCARALHIDSKVALRLAAVPFFPGPGHGGRDAIDAATWRRTASCEVLPHEMRVTGAAVAANERRPSDIVDAILSKFSVPNPSVLVVGVTTHRNEESLTKSPAIEILRGLRRAGAVSCWYDMTVSEPGPVYYSTGCARLFKWTTTNLEGFDAVVLAVDHAGVDYAVLESHRCVFDLCGGLPDREGVHRP